MDQTQFYKRVSDLLDITRLRARKAAVIGLGSGGCRVAAGLSRLGVQLFLVERPGERLEEHNIIRHVLGYAALGKSKLAEMTKYLTGLHPFAAVRGASLDVVASQQALARCLERWRPHVIAVCTDNEPSKHAVNEVAVRLGIPQTGGAVYDGGIGGEVYRVQPATACYGCIAAHLRLDRQASRQSSSSDYTNPQAADTPATSALGLDIDQIALLQCRMTLGLLLGLKDDMAGFPPEVNLCVFANRAVPGVFTRPLHAQFFKVARRPDCLSCSPAPCDLDRRAAHILAALGPAGRGTPH